MQPLSDRERFVATQPLPDHQERLAAQRRGAHVPNHVPFFERAMYALFGVTWIGWASIGLLSGHMYFVVSKRGAIHFIGLPALIFCVAVVASAVACFVTVVDHYDRRDNEASYRRWRLRLVLAAMGCLLLAGGVGWAERADLLPLTDGRLGLLSTPGLRTLLAADWLQELLVPRSDEINRWAVILMGWLVVASFMLKVFGLWSKDQPPHPVLALFMAVCVVGPALVSFTLMLLTTMVSGTFPEVQGRAEDVVRGQLAQMHSMLLMCLAFLAGLGVVVLTIVLRAVGVLPPLGPKALRTTRSSAP